MADLLTEVKDRVLYLTLNRPDKLNAMSAEMMGGLVDNLSRAATNPEIGAVVLTGAGRGFCSGGDIGGSGVEPALGISQFVLGLLQAPRSRRAHWWVWHSPRPGGAPSSGSAAPTARPSPASRPIPVHRRVAQR